jgi:dTDP-4-amino-4,6-dideoxygalactose transaminase
MTPFPEPIYVTRPVLPPVDDIAARLREVWASGWLTNGGAQHERLEAALAGYLGAPHFSLFTNGTIALLTAIRALALRGSVVTTPFTFPATPHVLAWSGIEPIFCDIDSETLTLDPAAVERSIRPDTGAILGVHVYGTPCDVQAFDEIASRRGLKVVYDGAHAFGTRVNGIDVARFGDVTMFSFHATKLFHTAEGGALACRDPRVKVAVDRLKNFGILNQDEVAVAGINGKMSELQAVMGLAVLPYVAKEIETRSAIAARYASNFAGTPGLRLVRPPEAVESSSQYCVVRIDPDTFGCSRDDVYTALQKYNVFTRKYFNPLCSSYPSYRHLPSASPSNLPVATRVVREVLCLPIYGALPLDAVDRISEMLMAVPRSAAIR